MLAIYFFFKLPILLMFEDFSCRLCPESFRFPDVFSFGLRISRLSILLTTPNKSQLLSIFVNLSVESSRVSPVSIPESPGHFDSPSVNKS